jgi:hypothetical protein
VVLEAGRIEPAIASGKDTHEPNTLGFVYPLGDDGVDNEGRIKIPPSLGTSTLSLILQRYCGGRIIRVVGYRSRGQMVVASDHRLEAPISVHLAQLRRPITRTIRFYLSMKEFPFKKAWTSGELTRPALPRNLSHHNLLLPGFDNPVQLPSRGPSDANPPV